MTKKDLGIQPPALARLQTITRFLECPPIVIIPPPSGFISSMDFRTMLPTSRSHSCHVSCFPPGAHRQKHRIHPQVKRFSSVYPQFSRSPGDQWTHGAPSTSPSCLTFHPAPYGLYCTGPPPPRERPRIRRHEAVHQKTSRPVPLVPGQSRLLQTCSPDRASSAKRVSRLSFSSAATTSFRFPATISGSLCQVSWIRWSVTRFSLKL